MNGYVFDLDNTLIFTDLLNNESYNHALGKFGLPLIQNRKRITRDVLIQEYPKLNLNLSNEIFRLKQDYFNRNLMKASVNSELFSFLESQDKDRCLLWTSADSSRVKALLEHFELSESFRRVLYGTKKKLDKELIEICKILVCEKEQLTFFEDNQLVIENLLHLKLRVIQVKE
jgi:beta-phosphoglucomutase-like phosphatase (HAD superfamily)